MLNICNHMCRRIHVVLLNGTVRTECKQTCSGSEYSKASHRVRCRDSIVRDVLCPYIP